MLCVMHKNVTNAIFKLYYLQMKFNVQKENNMVINLFKY